MRTRAVETARAFASRWALVEDGKEGQEDEEGECVFLCELCGGAEGATALPTMEGARCARPP
eukprot:2178718-Pyramimonas_sp.AAC.1